MLKNLFVGYLRTPCAYLQKDLLISLIEKDPGKYGYKIMGEMDKKGLWQTDTISHKFHQKKVEENET